jgi:hypothetical protein
LTCSDAREKLSALLERPPAEGSETLRQHVEGCADCRAELTLLIAADDKVRGALSRLGPAVPPPGYFEGLAARIDAGLDAPARSPARRGATRMMWTLGLTSLVCGAAGAALFVKTRMGSWGGTRPAPSAAAPPIAPAEPPTPVAPVVVAEPPADQAMETPAAKPMSARRVGPRSTAPWPPSPTTCAHASTQAPWW